MTLLTFVTGYQYFQKSLDYVKSVEAAKNPKLADVKEAVEEIKAVVEKARFCCPKTRSACGCREPTAKPRCRSRSATYRVRENRRLSSPKTDIGDIVNKSINQNLSRTINTSITTFAAITVVFIVSLIFDLPSVTSFALPMMVGIVSGCYTTNCIVGPLWVMWKKRGKKKKDCLLYTSTGNWRNYRRQPA